jgi:cytochrome c
MLGACGGGNGAVGPSVLSQQVAGGDPQKGIVEMQKYACGSCHTIPGVPQANGDVGPPLNAYARRGMIAGELPNTPENLVHWIQDPQGVKPGIDMPNMGIPDSEARDMAAYLYKLR